MRIAVIGTGNVGATLGRRFAEVGHDVVFGTRHPEGERAQAAMAAAPGTSARPPEDAVAGADLVVLAVPFAAVDDAVGGLGLPPGVVLVDATNPMGADVATTGAAHVAALAPDARVVKAFNTIGFEVMADPSFGGGRAVALVAGDDDDARATVATLAEAIGFEAVEVGGLDEAALVEAAARLWITLAFRRGLGRGFAFGLLRRSDG